MSVRRKIKSTIKRVMQWMPVTRRRMEREKEELRKEAAESMKRLWGIHDADKEKATKAASEVIRRCSRIVFENDSADRYNVLVSFDGRMFSHAYEREYQEFVARDIGRDVEVAIASGRYIQSAAENKRRYP